MFDVKYHNRWDFRKIYRVQVQIEDNNPNAGYALD